MICVKFTGFSDLRIRLATLHKSVRVNLHQLASPLGQGFNTHDSSSNNNKCNNTNKNNEDNGETY